MSLVLMFYCQSDFEHSVLPKDQLSIKQCEWGCNVFSLGISEDQVRVSLGSLFLTAENIHSWAVIRLFSSPGYTHFNTSLFMTPSCIDDKRDSYKHKRTWRSMFCCMHCVSSFQWKEWAALFGLITLSLIHPWCYKLPRSSFLKLSMSALAIKSCKTETIRTLNR